LELSQTVTPPKVNPDRVVLLICRGISITALEKQGKKAVKFRVDLEDGDTITLYAPKE